MKSKPSRGFAAPPYGTAIQQAIAAGDLKRMKDVAKEAEKFMAQNGDVRAALETLKIEIAKLESLQNNS